MWFANPTTLLKRHSRRLRFQPEGCSISLCRYFQQCEGLGTPCIEPRWTSTQLRELQSCGLTNLRYASQKRSPGLFKLGAPCEGRVRAAMSHLRKY